MKLYHELRYDIMISSLSPRKAEKPASPTVTNSRKVEITGLFIPVKPKYRLGNFETKTATNNVVSGSSGSGDPMLLELRGERVTGLVSVNLTRLVPNALLCEITHTMTTIAVQGRSRSLILVLMESP